MHIFDRSNDKLGSLTLVYSNKVLQEKDGFRGASHLTEHLKMRWILSENEEYDKYGLNYNAETGLCEVIFLLSGLSRYLKKFSGEFLHRILTYLPTREEFERERRTVVAEYGEALTDQLSVYSVNFLRRHYAFCGSLGLKDDLEALTYEMFLEFRNTVFARPDKLIEIAPVKGDYEIPFGPVAPSHSFRFGEYDSLPLETENSFENKSVAHLHLPLERETYPYVKFAARLLGGIGPLFKVLRQEHSLTYHVSVSTGRLSRESSVFDILAMVDRKNTGTALSLAREVLLNPEKHISRRRFQDEIFAAKVHREIREMSRASSIGRYLEPEQEQLSYLMEHKLLDYGMIMDLIRGLGEKAMAFADGEVVGK